ncbi:MAG: hypothetical protein WED04_08840 [Promethearchaeati archaeon SRVP18_Atabeyarchaeia-1]
MEKRPSTVKNGQTPQNYGLKIDGLLGAFRSEQVRWLISREKEIKKNSGISDEAYRQLVSGTVKREAERSTIIMELVRSNGGTIGEIASSTRIPEKQILRHMIALMKKGSVAIVDEKEGQYAFTAVEPPE